MLKGKSLLDYTDLFSLNEYIKNDRKILEHFLHLKGQDKENLFIYLW